MTGRRLAVDKRAEAVDGRRAGRCVDDVDETPTQFDEKPKPLIYYNYIECLYSRRDVASFAEGKGAVSSSTSSTCPVYRGRP